MGIPEMMPSCLAFCSASSLEFTPSLRYTADRWVFTVLRDKWRAAAALSRVEVLLKACSTEVSPRVN